MLAYDRHFSNPVIGGTGHAQCNIWSYELAKNEKLMNIVKRLQIWLNEGLLEFLVQKKQVKQQQNQLGT